MASKSPILRMLIVVPARINPIFNTFMPRLLAFNQSITFFYIWYKFLVVCSTVLNTVLRACVICVHGNIAIFNTQWEVIHSFMYIMKRRGPKIEPWGTQRLIVLNEEV